MKTKKSFLAVLLSIFFMFSCFVPSINCYAVNLSDINSYFDVQGKFYQILKRVTDISTTQEHQTNILNKMYDILENGGYSGSRSGVGLEQNGDVTINTNGDVLLSVDLQNALRQSVQYEIDNRMGFKYIYSGNSASFVSSFADENKYHAYLDFLSEHQNDFVAQYNFGTTDLYVFEDFPDLVYYDYSPSTATYSVRTYVNWSENKNVKVYQYDSNLGKYVTNDNISTASYCRGLAEIGANFPSNTNRIISLNTTQYKMYMSINDMKVGTQGLQSYYVGNDFSTSEVSTVQTITDSMLNSSINYSDIQNYVNSYYVTNQNYPTTNNVYNYINNYTGSGGGSGGDNGGGSDDDNNNIWDFLSSIGDFLGNLISSLGSVLSGILSLLTDVIDTFIGENGLPNIIGRLIEYFLPFLPTWIPQLIGLSVVLALIIGVVKLIRGR